MMGRHKNLKYLFAASSDITAAAAAALSPLLSVFLRFFSRCTAAYTRSLKSELCEMLELHILGDVQSVA